MILDERHERITKDVVVAEHIASILCRIVIALACCQQMLIRVNAIYIASPGVVDWIRVCTFFRKIPGYNVGRESPTCHEIARLELIGSSKILEVPVLEDRNNIDIVLMP